MDVKFFFTLEVAGCQSFYIIGAAWLIFEAVRLRFSRCACADKVLSDWENEGDRGVYFGSMAGCFRRF